MANVENLLDFEKITSNITSFSHAYLFNVNSLDNAYLYIKQFAKRIICDKKYSSSCHIDCNICYQIDNEEFDDFYVVNPDSIGINNEEIVKLFDYMKTKSIRNNGNRVYVIYGLERLSRDISNKLLKFLEEPNANIYAILMTENIDRVLPTIISRCQIINISFPKNIISSELISKMQSFLKKIIKYGNHTIAYTNEIFQDIMVNRLEFYDAFDILEQIIINNINKRYDISVKDEYTNSLLDNISLLSLTNILDITSHLKSLIKKNINLNLVVDRYIIEVTKELNLCKK